MKNFIKAPNALINVNRVNYVIKEDDQLFFFCDHLDYHIAYEIDTVDLLREANFIKCTMLRGPEVFINPGKICLITKSKGLDIHFDNSEYSTIKIKGNIHDFFIFLISAEFEYKP